MSTKATTKEKPQELANAIMSMSIITERLHNLYARIGEGDQNKDGEAELRIDNLLNLLDHGPSKLSSVRIESIQLINEIERLLFVKNQPKEQNANSVPILNQEEEETSKPRELASSIRSLGVVVNKLRDLSSEIDQEEDKRTVDETESDLDSLCSLLDNGPERLTSIREKSIILIDEIERSLFAKSEKPEKAN